MSQSTRILVVDDEPEVGRFLSSILATNGYEALATGDGTEAFELIRRAPADFDLVIADICMERMDGHELAAKIRALHPTIPVLLISAYLEDSDPAMLHTHFLQKPFSAKDLLARVRELTA